MLEEHQWRRQTEFLGISETRLFSHISEALRGETLFIEMQRQKKYCKTSEKWNITSVVVISKTADVTA